MGQRVLPLLNFSYGPDYFFTKNRYSWISHANLAMCWWKSSKISSSTVGDQLSKIACHVMILSWTATTPEFFFAALVIIKKLTDDLLPISATFTWFYKTENIVM